MIFSFTTSSAAVGPQLEKCSVNQSVWTGLSKNTFCVWVVDNFHSEQKEKVRNRSVPLRHVRNLIDKLNYGQSHINHMSSTSTPVCKELCP